MTKASIQITGLPSPDAGGPPALPGDEWTTEASRQVRRLPLARCGQDASAPSMEPARNLWRLLLTVVTDAGGPAALPGDEWTAGATPPRRRDKSGRGSKPGNTRFHAENPLKSPTLTVR